LKNKSRQGHILFEKDASQHDSVLHHPGMVSDACWIDLNKDGWPDLVVAGLFMPLSIFENEHGQLTDKTAAYGLERSQGWWTSLLAADFDHDGDTDLIVGNLGTNTQFKASDQQPLEIYYGDFSGNGTFDPFITYYIQGKSYPYASRDELLREIPAQQKKFARYAAYADAQMQDIFTSEQLAAAHVSSIHTLSSSFFRNDGNHHWTISPLPNRAQISVINGMVMEDSSSLILAGNLYPFRAQLGPLDAGIGLILQGDGKGNFTPQPYKNTGLCIPGDTRSLIEVKGKKYRFLVAASYGGPVQVLRK